MTAPDPNPSLTISTSLLIRVQTLAHLFEQDPQAVLDGLDSLIHTLQTETALPTQPIRDPGQQAIWQAIEALQHRVHQLESLSQSAITDAAQDPIAWEVWVVDPVFQKNRRMGQFDTESGAQDRAQQLQTGAASLNQERHSQNRIRYEVRPVLPEDPE